MTTWASDELDKIGTAEELEIASMRRDGTLRSSVIIWVARVGDDLYVRAYKGRSSPWFRGTQTRHEGHIQAGGVAKDVTFVEADGDAALNDRIDAEYRSKYRRYFDIVGDMVTAQARSATIQLVPRSTSS
jgi:hypothetical protein